MRVLRFLLVTFAAALPARADAIVVTQAAGATTILEVFVVEGVVRAELEIGLSDAKSFLKLLPDELNEKLGGDPAPLARRHERFFAEDLVLTVDGTTPLPGKVVELVARPRVPRDPITGEPRPPPEEPEIVIFAKLEYALPEPRPARLTLSPPSPAATIGFVVYHAGLPVIDFRYFGGQETLTLDWEDPWYSKFHNRNLTRYHLAPIHGFLYIEAFEVRKEIIARPRDLQRWVDLGLQGKKTIPVAEQTELKRRVAEFLAGRCPVEIDGLRVEPKLDRIHFVRRTLRKTGVVDPPEKMDATSATLGVIFYYPTKGLPKRVTMRWDLFSPKVPKMPAVATDEAGGLPTWLTPADPVLVWENFLKNPRSHTLTAVPAPTGEAIPLPLITLVCALALLFAIKKKHLVAIVVLIGVGAVFWPFARVSVLVRCDSLTTEQAGDVLQALLHNLYQAVDRRDESVVYDRLSASLSGDILQDVYLQMRKSMELENQGGARVKVESVELRTHAGFVGSSPLQGGVTWNVTGSVGHWGHTHRRTNEYRASLGIEPVDGVWKITQLDLSDEVRLPQTPNR